MRKNHFFPNDLKPLIIPCRTPKTSAWRLKFGGLCDPAVFKILVIFRVFALFLQFLSLRNAFEQQILGLEIFPYNYLTVLKVSWKSKAASCGTSVSQRPDNPWLDANKFWHFVIILQPASGIWSPSRHPSHDSHECWRPCWSTCWCWNRVLKEKVPKPRLDSAVSTNGRGRGHSDTVMQSLTHCWQTPSQTHVPFRNHSAQLILQSTIKIFSVEKLMTVRELTTNSCFSPPSPTFLNKILKVNDFSIWQKCKIPMLFFTVFLWIVVLYWGRSLHLYPPMDAPLSVYIIYWLKYDFSNRWISARNVISSFLKTSFSFEWHLKNYMSKDTFFHNENFLSIPWPCS